MLADKTLIVFHQIINKRNDDIILNYFFQPCLKMVESNSIETHNIYPNLND